TRANPTGAAIARPTGLQPSPGAFLPFRAARTRVELAMRLLQPVVVLVERDAADVGRLRTAEVAAEGRRAPLGRSGSGLLTMHRSSSRCAPTLADEESEVRRRGIAELAAQRRQDAPPLERQLVAPDARIDGRLERSAPHCGRPAVARDLGSDCRLPALGDPHDRGRLLEAEIA